MPASLLIVTETLAPDRLEVETDTPAPEEARGWAPSLLAWVLAGLSGAVTVLVHRSWQWSLIDDPFQVRALEQQVSRHGHMSGVLHRFVECAQSDWGWGLFRPAYWIYQSTFYLMGPTPARATRGFLLGLALCVPLIVIGRSLRGSVPYRVTFLAWSAVVLVSYSWLWDTISWASLQELPGIAFIALGLTTRRSMVRLGSWLVAACFKAPFAWLLCVWGIFLWRQGRRRAALASLSSGTGVLLAAAVFSEHGGYTARLSFDPAVILSNARTATEALWPTVTTLMIGALLLGVRVEWVVPPCGLPAVLGLGGFLYAANLLIWSAGGYYAIAPAWMLGTAGILIAAGAVRRESPAGVRRITAGVLGVIIGGCVNALPSTYFGLERQASRDDTVAAVVDFAAQVPPGTVIGIDDEEAADKFGQILAMKNLGQRRVRFTFISADDSAPTAVPYYVHLIDSGSGNPALMGELFAQLPRGAIYHVTTPAAEPRSPSCPG